MSSRTGSSLRGQVRILWAITANDLLALFKNKNIFMAFLAALFMVVFYRIFPEIMSQVEPQSLLIYDAGNSSLASMLENSQDLDVYTFPSEEKMKLHLSNGDIPELGLVIPADFDQSVANGDELRLQGYRMNWISPSQLLEAKGSAESEISRLIGRPVEVQLEGNILYPGPESHGLPVTVGISFVYVILMTALPMLPHLFLEEKQAHTLDALRVSPASEAQIITGKAFFGLFYCLLGSAVALVIFAHVILHWWLALLTVICGSLFSVAVALWLGMRIDNRGQLSVTLSIVVLPLLLPVFLALLSELIPGWIIQVCNVIPTLAIMRLFRISAAESIPWTTTLFSLAWLICSTAGILAWVTGMVRRMDRQEEPSRIPVVLSNLFSRRIGSLSRAAQPAQASLRPRLEPSSQPVPRPLQPFTRSALPSAWQMTWAIALKDLRTAIKNKVFLSILLSMAFLASLNLLLPWLVSRQDNFTMVVYDEGSSETLRGLQGREDFQLSIRSTRAEMEEVALAIASSGGAAIGLVLPASFDQQVNESGEILLDGYVSYRVKSAQARQWTEFFEQQLSQASGSRVTIEIDGHKLYPSLDSYGQPVMIVILLGIIILTLGLALVPLLFVEEKDVHTLDALLVSPAGFAPVVAGKALAGAAYCLAAAGIMVVLNLRMFIHWEAALLAILLSTFVFVAIGLLIGMLSSNATEASAWGGVVLFSMIGITALNYLRPAAWPEALKQILAWLPGAASLNLLRLSMVGEAPRAMLWSSASALLVVGLAGYLLVHWRMSRIGR